MCVCDQNEIYDLFSSKERACGDVHAQLMCSGERERQKEMSTCMNTSVIVGIYVHVCVCVSAHVHAQQIASVFI